MCHAGGRLQQPQRPTPQVCSPLRQQAQQQESQEPRGAGAGGRGRSSISASGVQDTSSARVASGYRERQRCVCLCWLSTRGGRQPKSRALCIECTGYRADASGSYTPNVACKSPVTCSMSAALNKAL